MRGRQQAPAGGNGVKCSGNNEVFRCPTRPTTPNSLVLPQPPLSRFRTTPAYIAMKLAHPIFSVSGISAPVGRQGDCKTCSASFFNYVQPPLTSRPRGDCPLRLSATLRLLGRTRDSPPLLILLSPSRNPLTILFHPFICRSPLLFEKKILIKSRDTCTLSLFLFAVRHPACLPRLHVIILSISPASLIALTPYARNQPFERRINPRRP